MKNSLQMSSNHWISKTCFSKPDNHMKNHVTTLIEMNTMPWRYITQIVFKTLPATIGLKDLKLLYITLNLSRPFWNVDSPFFNVRWWGSALKLPKQTNNKVKKLNQTNFYYNIFNFFIIIHYFTSSLELCWKI